MMDARKLRRTFELVLGTALPLSASACCSSRDVEMVIAESTPAQFIGDVAERGDGGLSDGGDCLEFCFRRAIPNCTQQEVISCGRAPDVDGGPAVRCEFRQTSCPQAPGVACGRRPTGFAAPPCAEHDDPTVGALFAQIAALEGASVDAFVGLRRELTAHGAPRRLGRAAARAARDEARHHRATAALARRHGAQPTALASRSAPRTVRTLEALAAENATEGCVRESFGALVATLQAQRAGDPVVRAVMARIAADETRHAALAWQVHTWARARLAPQARARVARAHAAAIDALARDLAREPPAAWVERAGLPTAPEASAMLAALRASLLHAA